MSPKRTQVVGGFDALRAAQRAQRGEPGQESGTGSSAPGQIAARAHHTALPTKHEIMCYECGYEFKVTGRTTSTHCPKCRKHLEITDYTIEGEWTEPLRTAGKIHVLPDAVLAEVDLIATDIILEGSAKDATLQAYRWLELGPASVFSESKLQAGGLRVVQGAEITLKKVLKIRDVEVHGVLNGKLRATGVVKVCAGALLKGDVQGARLVVEEGGGLKAKIKVVGVGDVDHGTAGS